jgi:hypothetical protein
MNKKTLTYYQDWNESRFIEMVLNAGMKSPQERWNELKELTALCRMLKPEESPAQQRQVMTMWEAYYRAIQTFEEKRRKHGTGTTLSPSESGHPA